MNSDQLIAEIDEVLPPVHRPQLLEVTFHKDDCFECEYFRKEIDPYTGSSLPEEAFGKIFDDLSCLSAKGMRWVLPSYLKHCLTKKADYDDVQTEFLIYALSPELKYQKETIQRLSGLSALQIGCLIKFLEWCANHEHWSDYCAEEIERGRDFLATLSAAREAARC